MKSKTENKRKKDAINREFLNDFRKINAKDLIQFASPEMSMNHNFSNLKEIVFLLDSPDALKQTTFPKKKAENRKQPVKTAQEVMSLLDSLATLNPFT